VEALRATGLVEGRVIAGSFSLASGRFCVPVKKGADQFNFAPIPGQSRVRPPPLACADLFLTCTNGKDGGSLAPRGVLYETDSHYASRFSLDKL